MTDKTRNVFVVHGRNHAARDAAYAFLQTIDLKPVTWEMAEKETGKAAPTTLEGVEAGLRMAQAVLVLMTGDDITRLRREYGAEIATSQPRPNVLIEAGMALSLLGRERVVMVRSNSVREITDFSGINYLDMDNTPAKRQALVERLRQAGCPADATGARHLDPHTGGDFEKAFKIDDVLPFHERGVFDENIVDSTISYRSTNIKLLDELEQQLLNPGVNDLKFSYLGVAGAANWLNLSKASLYSSSILQELTTRAWSKFFTHHSLTGKSVDLISLGPGDGDLDTKILNQITKQAKIINYYPVDISIELLQQTVEKTTPICKREKISVKAILGDFLELRKFKPIYGYDDYINVISLVGYTFANYNEGALLSILASAVNAGDFVIIDARLHKLPEVSGKTLKARGSELLPHFQHTANNRFAFGPVEMATTAEYSKAVIEQELSCKYTVVDEAFNVVTYCKDLNTNLRSGRAINTRRLDLAVTAYYQENALVEFIEERGFRVVDREPHGDSISLLLCRE